MARVRVKLNRAGVEELLKSAGVAADLEQRAERVLAQARATAPVVSGEYRDELHVVMDQHPSRVVAHVAGGTNHDMDVETEHGTLARALDAAR